MVLDNRILVTRKWLVTRTYTCGTMLGGTVGTPMYVEIECPKSNHKRKGSC